jgi:geranylgeranyl pyrophosphate synthase
MKNTIGGEIMDPIETWHDAPTFEAMEKRIKEKYAALVEAAKEVARISDRKHDAWDKLKAALAEIE